MCEPTDDWPCKFEKSVELDMSGLDLSSGKTVQMADASPEASGTENEFKFCCGPSTAEDDDEVTESKIRAFLDEKVASLFFFQRSFAWGLSNHSVPLSLPSFK